MTSDSFFYLRLKLTETLSCELATSKEPQITDQKEILVKPRRTKERSHVSVDLFGLCLSLVKLAISLFSSRLFEMSSLCEPNASAIAVL